LRFAVIAVLAAVTPAVLLTHTAGLVAAPIAEAPPAVALPVSETPAGAGTKAAHPRPIDHAASIDIAPPTDSRGGWFDGRELKLGAAGADKSDMFVDPTACIYPEAYLRSLAGGRDDCGVLKPGQDETETLTLPFLALSGWMMVICAVAALYHFHRNWRVRRWLRRMEAQGLVPSGTHWRRSPHRRSGGRAGTAGRARGVARAEPITPQTSSARAK
jgi:hypothetical protein